MCQIKIGLRQGYGGQISKSFNSAYSIFLILQSEYLKICRNFEETLNYKVVDNHEYYKSCVCRKIKFCTKIGRKQAFYREVMSNSLQFLQKNQNFQN